MANMIRERSFYKQMLSIAIPVIAQQVITVGVGLIDNIMVGKLQETVLSGCTAALQIHDIFHNICLGLSLGGSIIMARFWGAKSQDGLNQTITLTIRIGLLIAAIFTLATAIAPHQLVALFSDDAQVISEGVKYLRVSLPCYILVCCSLIATMILRNIRKIRVPLYASIGAFFINIFFNWIFIFGKLGAPAMGISGAALGTLLSRIFECFAMVGFLLFKEKNLQYDMRHVLFLPCRSLLPEYLKISIPVMISDTLLGLGNSVTTSIIGHIDKMYMSAYSITAVTQRVTTVFSVGLSQASSIIIGNTLGKGDKKSAQDQGFSMAVLAALIGTICGCLILFISPFIISSYNITDVTRELTRQFMAGVVVTTILITVSNVLTKGVLRGGGDTRFLMVADVVFLWLLCVPLGYLAGHVWHWSPFYIFLALRIDHVAKIILCAFRLRSKKWMKKI